MQNRGSQTFKAMYTRPDACAIANWPSCTRHRKLVTGSDGDLSDNIEIAGAPDHVH